MCASTSAAPPHVMPPSPGTSAASGRRTSPARGPTSIPPATPTCCCTGRRRSPAVPARIWPSAAPSEPALSQGVRMATYVLIHGAYQGAWIWKPVVARLHEAGHVAHALTLDGCAERAHALRRGITVGSHAQEVAQLLFYEDLTDIVLVGTSSGGMVVQKAAELARARVGRPVFVDALALIPPERVDHILKRAT